MGIALGLLVALQFFLSTEILAITAITVGLGFLLFAVYHLIAHFTEARRRVGRIATGLGVGAVLSSALLAYPVWFAFAGPAHLSGRIWPTVVPGYYGTNWQGFFRLTATAQATVVQQRLGGYQGTALHQPFYLGYGLAAVLVVGGLLWWRDRRLWLLATMTVVTMSFCLTSFEVVNRGWVPWRVLARIPVVENILPDRFASMTYLAAAAMVALIADHVRTSVSGLDGPVEPEETGTAVAPDRGRGSGAHSRRRPTGPPRWRVVVAALVALAVAAVALVPIAWEYRGNVPFAVRPVVLPDWFVTVAPHLPPGQVVLTYPLPSELESPMAWQAVGNMRFALVGGSGPYDVPERAGPERPGYEILSGATLSVDPATAFLPSTVAKVRSAVLGWGTTLVVIPDQPELPAYDQGYHTAYAVAMMTAALGEAPSTEANAWTFTVGAHPAGPLTVTPAALSACVGNANFPPGPPDTVPNCVLVASAAVAPAPSS